MSMAEGDVPTPTPPPSEGRRTWPIELVKVLALPLVTLVLGYWFNSSLNERQQIDNNVRLYAEMMGRREEADSNLRKDMFNSILATFMSKEPGMKVTSEEVIRQQILSLELQHREQELQNARSELQKFRERAFEQVANGPPAYTE